PHERQPAGRDPRPDRADQLNRRFYHGIADPTRGPGPTPGPGPDRSPILTQPHVPESSMTVPHRAHRHAPTRRSAIRWTGVLAFAAATGGAPLAAQDDIAAGALAASRTAAGTAWQPELTPKPGLHGSWGGWSLMGHGALSLGYVREESPKGGAQLGSTNWVMLSATRRAGTGVLALTLMGSVEPLTLGDCGQPRLLAVSGTCPTDGYSDYQHPHPPVMELSARYVEP